MLAYPGGDYSRQAALDPAWRSEAYRYRYHKPYGKATYAEIGGPDGHLANMREFKGASMWAQKDHGWYQVFSYDTVILEAALATGEIVHANPTKYGPITAKHRSLAQAWTGAKKQTEESHHAS